MYLAVSFGYSFVHRNLKVILFNLYKDKLISRIFKLGGNDLLVLCDINREGNECGRYVNIVKGSGH